MFLVNTLICVSQEKTDSSTLFPESDHFEGWALKDSIHIFTRDNLFDHVQESTDLYNEFGTVISYQAIYTNPKAVRIKLDIFEMEHPDDAWGIFTLNSSGKGQADEIGDISILYDYYIHLVKGPFYIKCTTSKNDDEYKELIRQFGLFASEQIPTTAKEPAILKAFEFKDFVVKEKKYFKGQIALSDIYEFGHGTIAGFEQGASSRSEGKMFFIFSYSSERKRREWFASVKGKMNMNQRFSDYQQVETGITALDRTGNVFAFYPYKNFIFVVKGYTWEEAVGIFGIMATNLDSAIH